MKAYSFNRETKEYQGEVSCQPNPVDGGFLIPGHATDIKPEQPKEGHVVVFKDKDWVEIIDHRGLVFNKDTKQSEQWSVIGELPPSLTKLVPKEYDKWDEEKEEWVGHIQILYSLQEHKKQQLEYEASYEFKRMSAYPLIIDQLDTLYWDMKNGTDNWVKSREAVKEKYPKPENKNEKI